MAATAVNYRSEWSRRLHVTGARVSEVEFRPNHFCPAHWHRRPSLGIVLKGQIRKQFSDVTVEIPANDAFTMPAGILHTDHFGPGSRAVVIEIEPEHPLSIQRLEVCGTIFERWRRVEDEQLRWMGHRLAGELSDPDHAATLAIDGLIGEILSVVTRSATEKHTIDIPDWLMEAREIAGNVVNRRVSVAEIADEVGVHPAYLARRFRAEFGVTPGAFARNARLDWAAGRLIESEISISELAIQAGFADQSHFTRAFRRYIDKTPGTVPRKLSPQW